MSARLDHPRGRPGRWRDREWCQQVVRAYNRGDSPEALLALTGYRALKSIRDLLRRLKAEGYEIAPRRLGPTGVRERYTPVPLPSVAVPRRPRGIRPDVHDRFLRVLARAEARARAEEAEAAARVSEPPSLQWRRGDPWSLVRWPRRRPEAEAVWPEADELDALPEEDGLGGLSIRRVEDDLEEIEA